MQLFVRGVGLHSALVLEGSDTINDLKQHLQASHGIPVSEQLLVSMGGRPLMSDMATLSASGLTHGTTVQLLLRLCGGKGGFGALLRGQGRDGKITDNFDACRDLSGRRIRHVEAEKKLKQWEQETKERELEQLALKHMKEMAKQAKRERDHQVNVEEVKRQHKEAADRVAEAVQTALAEGLNKEHKQGGSKSSSADGSGSSSGASAGTAAAAAAAAAAGGSGAAAGHKRKDAVSAAAAGASGSPVKKRKVTMLDLVEGSDSGSDSDDESDAE